MGVSEAQLAALYAGGDDPWGFRSSDYEAAKYAATVAALPDRTFAHILELGCGNGELARRLSARSARYTGLDAMPVALDAARRAVPGGRFVRGFLPCALPPGDYDLIVLSEILYFLDAGGLDTLAEEIDAVQPAAEILCVTWRGPSGNPLEGEAALTLFAAACDGRRMTTVRVEPSYRIDRLGPVGGDAAGAAASGTAAE